MTTTLIALLQQAKKPVALVGAGAKLSGAIGDLQELLDVLQVPAFATVHGLGAVNQESPYYLGMVGMHGTRAANMALHDTDLLMVFGARLDDRVTGDPSRFAPHAQIVHFEIDPSQLDRVRTCELPVIGNLAETIPAFLNEVRHAHLPDWRDWREDACSADRAEPPRADQRNRRIDSSMNCFIACRRIRRSSRDVGQHQMWAAQRYRRHRRTRFHHLRWAGIDGVCPAGSCRRAAGEARDEKVLCVSGDGGFQMNIQELATVHRLGLPIKMVIIDNKYLGMVRQWQQLFYDRNYAETDLSDNPDFVAIGRAYKIRSFAVNEEELQPETLSDETVKRLNDFLSSPEPELLVFECHPEANVYPMVPAGAALSEMVFEEE